MPTPITAITLAEIKQYYPVTDSLSQDKINTVTNHVKNVIFLEMFGFSLSNKIFTGEVPNSEGDDFMGFRLFTALNIAAYFAGEVYTHTNAGLKAITQPNWSNPSKADKNTTVTPLSDAVTAQFLEAKKILDALSLTPKNEFTPYSSFQIDKI